MPPARQYDHSLVHAQVASARHHTTHPSLAVQANVEKHSLASATPCPAALEASRPIGPQYPPRDLNGYRSVVPPPHVGANAAQAPWLACTPTGGDATPPPLPQHLQPLHPPPP